MLNVGTIITLKNNTSYKILKELMDNGKKFFLVENIESLEQTVFLEEVSGINIYIREVLNKEYKRSLINKFNN